MKLTEQEQSLLRLSLIERINKVEKIIQENNEIENRNDFDYIESYQIELIELKILLERF